MSFLDDLRRQPRHHREIMFGLCVLTSVSMVGMVWFNSFQKNLYVLLNPEDTTDQRYLADNKTAPSLLGDIGQTGQDLKASFLSIFNLTGGNKKDTIIDNTTPNEPARVYTLPLSETK
jgi:hypothetical protein